MATQQRRPRYIDIAEDIAARLADVGPGGRLPTETELARELGVNRLTARAAVQELERRYLVHRHRGRGTFVTTRVDYIVSAEHPPSWHETVRLAGAIPREETEHVEVRRRPTAAVRRNLNLDSGDKVIAMSRLRYVNNELAGCSDVILNAALVPGLEEKLESSASIYRYLRDHYRLEPYRGWSEVSLEAPPPEVADKLHLTGQPMLFRHCSRVDSATARRPVEYVTAWLRPEVVRVRVCYGSATPPGPNPQTSRQ
jgi:GntR family transcriptional regulator